jgi:hypothetical protein
MKELQQILDVTNAELDSLDANFINRYNFYHNISYFQGKAGREHYRLLMYVSSIFSKEKLFDIGTNRCMSAAAMSHSMKNQVITYDIIKLIIVNPFLPRVEYVLGDCREDKRLLESPFIFFDVDHNGKFEYLFYEFLKENKYKGLVMCDDIHLNEPMKKWWETITEDKYDLTEKGHWSGTGLIHFK